MRFYGVTLTHGGAFLSLSPGSFRGMQSVLQEGKSGKGIWSSMEENVRAINAKHVGERLVRKKGRCMQDYENPRR